MPKTQQKSLDSFFLGARPKSKENAAVNPNKRKQRAILDDDDVPCTKKPTTTVPKTVRSNNDDDSHQDRTPSDNNNKTTAKSSSQNDNDTNKPANKSPSQSKPKPANLTKTFTPTHLFQDAPSGQFDSDAALWKDRPWPSDSRLPYAVLCQTLAEIEAITSRLQIQQILTRLFRHILVGLNNANNTNSNTSNNNPNDLHVALYLTSNSVAPACDNVELGIGDSLLIKAVAEATGSSRVKQLYEQAGDLGTVAQQCKSKQTTLGGFFVKHKSNTNNNNNNNNALTAPAVLQTFRAIASTKGHQSQKWKIDKIKRLLVQCQDPVELKYIVRGLQGKLRIGLAQSTVLISLAHALALTRVEHPSSLESTEDSDLPDEVVQYLDDSQTIEKRLDAAAAIVKRAYSEVPSYDALVDAALRVPLPNLHRACTLQPGIPVAPMLAKPTKSIQEVLQRLNGQQFTCEYKYDGERAQIHVLPDGSTRVFSRNLLDTSEKFPEVPLYCQAARTIGHDDNKNKTDNDKKHTASYILDAEVVALKDGKLVPFQILSTRKKTETSATSATVQIMVHAFDLMYWDGASLLSRPLQERRALLREHFRPVDGQFQFATHLDHTEDGDTTVLEDFLDQAVKGCCEGLMIKTLQDVYEPSRRSLNWLKLKKDYLEGLGDSVDLVPLGAYHGRGKRTGVYGAYLLACYDPDTEEFQSVCKIGTGFSEQDLQTLATALDQHRIPAKTSQYNVTDTLECDVWFDAVQVWEVKAADLSQSSAHRGAVGKTGEAERGIGLRFPRFERVRTDKRPEDATTSDQILEMYYQQDVVGGAKTNNDDEDGI